MSQEARFLEAREARAAAQRPRRQSHHENLHEFWNSLRQDLAAWQYRLDALEQHETPIQTASQRTKCRENLDILLRDLQRLRRNCLSSTDVPELPPADVRLLHQEFTTLATKLDQVRQDLIPPTKFTFKRYHAAMQQQQQQQSLQAGDSNDYQVPKRAAVPKAPHSLASLGGNVIQDYHDATVILESNGVLTMEREGEDDSIVEQPEKLSSSLLLQNLERCQVTM